MSLHGLLVCLWQQKMWKMWKKWKFQNFWFLKARLAFHHVEPPNIDVLRGSKGFYQILRRQLHIPSRPEQKQSCVTSIIVCEADLEVLCVLCCNNDDRTWKPDDLMTMTQWHNDGKLCRCLTIWYFSFKSHWVIIISFWKKNFSHITNKEDIILTLPQ